MQFSQYNGGRPAQIVKGTFHQPSFFITFWGRFSLTFSRSFIDLFIDPSLLISRRFACIPYTMWELPTMAKGDYKGTVLTGAST